MNPGRTTWQTCLRALSLETLSPLEAGSARGEIASERERSVRRLRSTRAHGAADATQRTNLVEAVVTDLTRLDVVIAVELDLCGDHNAKTSAASSDTPCSYLSATCLSVQAAAHGQQRRSPLAAELGPRRHDERAVVAHLLDASRGIRSRRRAGG
jgi:hypothetical protein